MTYADESAARAALADGSAIPADLRQIVVTYPALRPAVASYPGTDDPMLGWLRDLRDPAVDAALAARARLAESQPTEVLPTQPLPAASPAAPGATVPASAQPRATPPASPTVGPPGPTPPQPRGPARPATPAAPAPTQQFPTVQSPVGPIAPIPPTGPAPGPPTPAFTSVTPPPANRPGSGAKVAIVAVVALLLVGGGVYAAFAAGLLPGFGAGSSATPAPQTPSGDPTPSEPPASPAEITPTPIVPPSVGFACWDASEADVLAECVSPRTAEQVWQYLGYVYPSLARHDGCQQFDSTGKSDYQGVTAYWQCELGDSLLRYRYWVDPSDAERHYGRKFKEATAATYEVTISGQPVAGWVKTSAEASITQADGSKRYVATMWLPELQLSMSAEGDDVNAMWNAFELVRIRPLDQVNGHPLGTDPSAVPLTVTEQ